MDLEVDLLVLVGNNLGKCCPWALCGGYTNYCRVVDLGSDCQNVNGCLNIRNLYYYGNLDNCGVSRSCNPCSNGGDPGDKGSVHLCGVLDWGGFEFRYDIDSPDCSMTCWECLSCGNVVDVLPMVTMLLWSVGVFEQDWGEDQFGGL